MRDLTIAVLGANGQLGRSLNFYIGQHPVPDFKFHFFSAKELDITDAQQLTKTLFGSTRFDYIINCAAYTEVDLAEKEQQTAENTNSVAVKHLAEDCQNAQTTLIHISTDFVFDGTTPQPLNEKAPTNPINHYGKTKWQGEQEIINTLHHHFILRTGWLYSNYRNNFYKTMNKLFQERENLSVVYDQLGTPTYTMVLVKAILRILKTKSTAYGVYHIANEGVASWYDFAYEILKNSDFSCRLSPILSHEYPTPAKRPAYTVLDKNKFKREFDMEFPHWKESLLQCISHQKSSR